MKKVVLVNGSTILTAMLKRAFNQDADLVVVDTYPTIEGLKDFLENGGRLEADKILVIVSAVGPNNRGIRRLSKLMKGVQVVLLRDLGGSLCVDPASARQQVYDRPDLPLLIRVMKGEPGQGRLQFDPGAAAFL